METITFENFVQNYYEPINVDTWVMVQDLNSSVDMREIEQYSLSDLEKKYKELIEKLNIKSL